MTEEAQAFATSPTLFDLYRTLAGVQAKIIDELREVAASSPAQADRRAKEIIQELIRLSSPGGCTPPERYDPVLDACVFIPRDGNSKPTDSKSE